jgi:serine/threonine protein kinase
MTLENLVGKTIDGYHLLELIGTGAMGAVYRAHQLTLEREVAIKVLPAHLSQQPDYVARFNREAKIVAALEHPHIVPLHDFGTYDGIIYVAMRLIRGGTLADRINERARTRGALPSLGEVAAMLRDLANALDYAHSRQIVHRDIKPSNIMFDEQGSAYLVDFGIARLIDANSAITMNNMTFGTPHYMPPEQWRDENLTPETDQYALAVVIFSLIAGKPPFDAPTPHALMYKHFNDTPPDLTDLRADLPPALTAVLRRALSKRPDERFETVELFARAFDKAIVGAEGKTNGFFTFRLPEKLNTPPLNLPPVPPAAPPPVATLKNTPIPPPPPAPNRPAAATMPNLPAVPPPPAPQPLTQPYYTTGGQRPPTPRRRGGVPPLMIGIGIGLALLAVVFIAVIGVIGVQLGWFERGVPPTQHPAIGSPATIVNNTPAAEPTSALVLQPVAPRGTPIAADSARSIAQIGTLPHGAETVRAVAYSPDGLLLATGAADGIIRLWQGTAERGSMSSGAGVTYALAFSPDGSQLISGHDDGSVRLWDVASRQEIAQYGGHTAAVRGVAFSPDGLRAASASEDFTVRVWTLAAGSSTVLEGHTNRAQGVAFSPDGSLLASAADDGSVRVWDPDNGIEVLLLGDQTTELRAVAFSPDGSLLAAPAVDGTIRLWALDTGEEVRALQGHQSWVWHVAFSPDGSLLVSGGRDNTVRLWDVTTGAALATLTGHTGWVLGVAFSPGGGEIASAGGDGTARLWAAR